MNLGFRDQFVPFVEDGSKTHSIRAGERWKVGMRADCYARPRQKGMRLLFRAPVVRVEEIEIYMYVDPVTLLFTPKILIDDILLEDTEANLFAWRDGFRDIPAGPSDAPYSTPFQQMMRFWQQTHKLLEQPFHGQIIHWDYANRDML